ncbi:hypothetical protein S40285_09938 [Stachybotrys chlorohalonatus IBT 40285]|uniref:Uncharacterized protein n=1 Tax=Stachybotrys chlorohalonatus (strain IBT 40285) TaxID=1283841 RepID=A0A084QHG5_STAC4|nr:hypothetical protein S40285_09938 [Stachybotrys chlorohalonata IBT 40285]
MVLPEDTASDLPSTASRPPPSIVNCVVAPANRQTTLKRASKNLHGSPLDERAADPTTTTSRTKVQPLSPARRLEAIAMRKPLCASSASNSTSSQSIAAKSLPFPSGRRGFPVAQPL